MVTQIKCLKTAYIISNFVSIFISLSLMVLYSLMLYSLDERQEHFPRESVFAQVEYRFRHVFLAMIFFELFLIMSGLYGILILLGRNHFLKVNAVVLTCFVILYVIMSISLVFNVDGKVQVPDKYREKNICLKSFSWNEPFTIGIALKGVYDCIYITLWVVCTHVTLLITIIAYSFLLWNHTRTAESAINHSIFPSVHSQ